MLLNNVKEWLETLVDTNLVSLVAGEYIETEANKGKYLLVIKQSGGSVRPPFVRYPRFTLTLFGRHGKREDVLQLEAIIDKIIKECELGTSPECMGGGRIATLPTGAFYTKENRAFFVFDLEFIY